MLDVSKTIISQYATSPTIRALIAYMDEYIDPRADIDQFYSDVFDIQTARGFGLDIWGRIVNVARELRIPPEDSHFGFIESATPGVLNGLTLDFVSGAYTFDYAISADDTTPFNDTAFYDPAASNDVAYRLTDEAYRKLILLKALANICDCSIPSINQLLSGFFSDRGRCYVSDTGGMVLRYTFEFTLSAIDFAIITQSGVIPRPAGVTATLLHSALPVFGFSEAGTPSAAPFDVGNFLPENAYATI